MLYIYLGKLESSKPCQNALTKKMNVKCAVYENTECDDKQGALMLEKGEYQSFLKGVFRGGVGSVTVKTGCQLTVWKGKMFVIRYLILPF